MHFRLGLTTYRIGGVHCEPSMVQQEYCLLSPKSLRHCPEQWTMHGRHCKQINQGCMLLRRHSQAYLRLSSYQVRVICPHVCGQQIASIVSVPSAYMNRGNSAAIGAHTRTMRSYRTQQSVHTSCTSLPVCR